MLVGLSPTAHAQARWAAKVQARSTFHPFRDLATLVAPGIVPPKGCAPQDIDLARKRGVAPDLTGCLPGDVGRLIWAHLGMRPQVSPDGPDARTTPIIDKDPPAGQPLAREGTFTLFLPRQTITPTAQPAATPAPPPAVTPATQPAATPAPVAGLAAPPSPTPSAGTPQAGDTNSSAPTGASSSPQTPAVVVPPKPGPWTEAWNWFWDGLNPLWVMAGVLAAGFGVRRLLQPPRIVLPGPPTVSCDLTMGRGASPRWRDNRHIVLNAPLIDVEFSFGPAIISPLQNLGERLEP